MLRYKFPYVFEMVSLCAGGLLPLAFAPFHWFWIPFIILPLLLGLWETTVPKQAFLRGLLFGLGFFGCGVSWLYISIHEFGHLAPFLAALITLLFTLVLASLIAFQGYLYVRLFPVSGSVRWLIGFPTLWILFEWLREWIFTGFPWLIIGYSQISSPLRGFGPVIGVYGISFLVAFISALLFCLLKIKRTRVRCALGLGVVCISVCGLGLNRVEWTHPQQKPLTVSLIQGNIPQTMYWTSTLAQESLERYLTLTQSHWNSQLIVWPEAAIPIPLSKKSPILEDLSDIAKQHHAHLILGLPLKVEDKFYNAAISLGQARGVYYKQHLVPFGEYVPWTSKLIPLFRALNIPFSELSAGPRKQSLIHIQGRPVAFAICYEVAYPELIRQYLPQAQLLIALTNDAWFGDSIAADQQVEMAQMRSLETGRYTVHVANNGVTAVINHKGQIVARLPRFKTAVLESTVHFMTCKTPWVSMGNVPVLIVNVFFLFCGIVRRRFYLFRK